MEESKLSETNDKKREAFGNRHLTDEQNVFQFNAWFFWLIGNILIKNILKSFLLQKG